MPSSCAGCGVRCGAIELDDGRRPHQRRAPRRGGAAPDHPRPARARGSVGPPRRPVLAAGVAACGAGGRAALGAGGHGRGGAVGHVERQRAGRPVARGGPRRGPRPAPAPTATSTPCWACSTPPRRFVDRLPAPSPDAFLDHVLGQDVAGDTLVARAPAGESVALLTPAAAAGRQWRLVVVAGVQEGGLARPAAARLAARLGRPRRRRDRSRAATRGPRSAAGAPRRDPAVPRRRDPGHASGCWSPPCAARTSSPRPTSTSSTLCRRRSTGRRPAERAHRLDRALTLPSLVAALRRAGGVRRPGAAGAVPSPPSRAWPGRRAAVPTRRRWWALHGRHDDRPRRGPEAPVRVSPSPIDGFRRCGLQVGAHRARGGDGPVDGLRRTSASLVHEVAAEHGDSRRRHLRAALDASAGAGSGLPPGWSTGASHAEAELDGRPARTPTSPRHGAAGWQRVAPRHGCRVALGRAVAHRSGRPDRASGPTARCGSSTTRPAQQAEGDDVARHGQLGCLPAGRRVGGASSDARGPLVRRRRPCSSSARRPRPEHDPAAPAPLARRRRPRLGPRPRRRDRPTRMGGAAFAATPGAHVCRHLPGQGLCPAQPEGRAL